jgi:hypothetical protein
MKIRSLEKWPTKSGGAFAARSPWDVQLLPAAGPLMRRSSVVCAGFLKAVDRRDDRRLELTILLMKQGNPLDPSTMIGAQASSEQMEKILSYLDIGKQEGAKVLIGGERNNLGGDLAGGYYIKPTVFQGHNKMRAAMPTGSTASAAPSRPAVCGPIAITPIRPMRPSAVISNRASAARTTR